MGLLPTHLLPDHVPYWTGLEQTPHTCPTLPPVLHTTCLLPHKFWDLPAWRNLYSLIIFCVPCSFFLVPFPYSLVVNPLFGLDLQHTSLILPWEEEGLTFPHAYIHTYCLYYYSFWDIPALPTVLPTPSMLPPAFMPDLSGACPLCFWVPHTHTYHHAIVVYPTVVSATYHWNIFCLHIQHYPSLFPYWMNLFILHLVIHYGVVGRRKNWILTGSHSATT